MNCLLTGDFGRGNDHDRHPHLNTLVLSHNCDRVTLVALFLPIMLAPTRFATFFMHEMSLQIFCIAKVLHAASVTPHVTHTHSSTIVLLVVSNDWRSRFYAV